MAKLKKTGFQITFEDGETQTRYLQPLESEARAIVHFRPKSDWRGEYGFDWYRESKENERDNNISYDNLIGKYYDDDSDTTMCDCESGNKWTEYFTENRIDLNNLKEIYSPCEYSLHNPESNSLESRKYYTPIITLFPADDSSRVSQSTADLQLYIEKEEHNSPDVIEFKIEHNLENSPITLNKNEITYPNDKETVRINCNTSFSEDIMIKVIAKKGSNIKEVGKLKIIAPSKKQVKKVLIVKVKTRRGAIGQFNERGVEKLKSVLGQSLTTIDINETQLFLDVSNSNLNYRNADFHSLFRNNRRSRTIKTTKKLASFLWKQFKSRLDRSNNYLNHFIIFCIGEKCITNVVSDSETSVRGFSTLNQNYTVLFSNADKETVAHEVLHGLGLRHSFDNKALFTYKAQETHNMMDYSHWKFQLDRETPNTPKERYHTWYWQWKLVNNKID